MKHDPANIVRAKIVTPPVENDIALPIVVGAFILILFFVGIMTSRDIRHMGAQRESIPEKAEAPHETNNEDAVPKTGTDVATISMKTQTAAMSVLVDRVALNTSGWIVVHEVEGGHVLNALGAKRLDAGEHAGVLIELLRATEPGRAYAIILYSDNGNKEFEVRGDLPMIDKSGDPLMETFRTFGGGASTP